MAKDKKSVGKLIRLHLKLDYKQMQYTVPEDFLPPLALQFLQSIDEYPKHRLQDFDWKRYKKDVARLFEARGWLEPVEQG